MSVVPTVCCCRGTGRGVPETGAGKIAGVRGDPAHPANRGKLCTRKVDAPARLCMGNRAAA
jgi:assimilatory nitrate reductase catalytic subunit